MSPRSRRFPCTKKTSTWLHARGTPRQSADGGCRCSPHLSGGALAATLGGDVQLPCSLSLRKRSQCRVPDMSKINSGPMTHGRAAVGPRRRARPTSCSRPRASCS
eukprot:5108473-Pyramimonas_sp.AAC.1